MLAAKIKKCVRSVAKSIWRLFSITVFAFRFRSLRNKRKIIYALKPPAHNKNVGDQAQVIAIRRWLQKHYPQLPVIELSRNESRYFLPALRWLVKPQDTLLLQSGGNMGDFNKPAENLRLMLISAFPNNKVVSLPQTIHFDKQCQTEAQRERMCRIYQGHQNLMIFARDPESERLGRQFLPGCRIELFPDFVLSMQYDHHQRINQPPRVLLCFRKGNKSILSSERRLSIKAELPYVSMFYDTCIGTPLAQQLHEKALMQVIKTIQSFDVIVTDRLHGLIFSVICHKPCVAFNTSTHKMRGGYEWFRDLPFVMFARAPDDIPMLIEQCLKVEDREIPNWNARYFDQLPGLIKLTE